MRSRTSEIQVRCAIPTALCLSLILGCATTPRSGSTSEPSLPAPLEKLYAAFNRHDVDAMASVIAPDFKWFSVGAKGDGLGVEAESRDALVSGLRDYFKAVPGVRSEVLRAIQDGPYVSIVERVHWTSSAGEKKTASSLSVYELRDGAIIRLWTWPAQP